MNILVTGGAGFIGSNLVDRLVELGYTVIAIDNFLTGSRDNLNSKAIFYEEDIRNKDALDKIFEKHKPEYIFHTAAGYLVQSLENPQRDAEINIIGTINLIELSLKYKVKKIIYSNSGGASYGEPLEIPITEEHSIHPLTPYGASKYTAEMYLYMYSKNFGLKYTSLRYANVYGPRQNPKLEGGVISIFLNSFLKGESPIMRSDGTPTRDYVYVGDVVEANIMAMEKGECEGYHVATEIETSVLDLVKTMKKVLNTNLDVVRGPPRIGDPQRAVFSISKIKRAIGWQPKVALEEGIRKTVEWMKAI
ncbi:MAG: NAD-dependent epimerase/dehydratase family protein [Nanoarchaeota archaeon]|nr:NAD-dependent epimerase/dehydratase family protein [Nanoarchaeota archaeon]